ncbi:MAG TPA: hypothetical protein VGS23_03470 [Thermoplasmata archaeon]|nr:hypothetical protein [Thermoplasmata archaeon]
MAGKDVDGSEEVGRETRWLFVRLLLTTFPPLALLGGILGVLFVETTPRLPAGVIPALVGVAGALASVHAWTEVGTYPTRVRLSPTTLSLTYPKFGIEAPWEDWTPIGRSRLTGGIAFRTRWGSPRGYLVSPDQARRIYRFRPRSAWPDGPGAGPSTPNGPPP